MTTMQALPKNNPEMKAWELYKQTPNYFNTREWATKEEHTDGSLWAAFDEGYHAAKIDESDLLKILDALKNNEDFHRKRDEMNGAIHLAREVRYSPLTAETIAARERLESLLKK
jgi:hypothetical protein